MWPLLLTTERLHKQILHKMRSIFISDITRARLYAGNAVSLASPTGSGNGTSDLTPPELPTQCCMSGCANCVWLDYAEELVKFYEVRGQTLNLDQLLAEIDENLNDEMVKAFIKMEVKNKFLFNMR